MAREIIRPDTTATVTGNVGDSNSNANQGNLGDNNTGTSFDCTTQDTTGALTSYEITYKAATTKSKTWTYYRGYHNTYLSNNWMSSGSGGFATIYYKNSTGSNVTTQIGTSMNVNHTTTTVSRDQYSSLTSGNPTITAATTNILKLWMRSYAGTMGSTDQLNINWYEAWIEGFSAPTITSINGGSSFTSGSNVEIVGTEFDSADAGGSYGVTLSAGYSKSSVTYNSDTSITVNGVTGPAGSCTFTVTTMGGAVSASQTLASAGTSKFFAFF